MAVNPIPADYARVTPNIVADPAERVADFMKQVFGAQERMRMPMPGGKIAHAELTIGDSVVMLADPAPDFPPSPVTLHVYVEDIDATYRKALAAGGSSLREPATQFYGDRSAAVVDPAGNRWSIATRVEDVPEDEMMKRMEAMSRGG